VKRIIENAVKIIGVAICLAILAWCGTSVPVTNELALATLNGGAEEYMMFDAYMRTKNIIGIIVAVATIAISWQWIKTIIKKIRKKIKEYQK
jgi:hypothetical protein